MIRVCARKYHNTDNPWKNTPPWVLELVIRLDQLADRLGYVLAKEEQLMSALTDALDRAEEAATANASADDAAEALLVTLSGLIADLKANGTDPATIQRIDTLATAIKARAAQLGTAVAATPTT